MKKTPKNPRRYFAKFNSDERLSQIQRGYLKICALYERVGAK